MASGPVVAPLPLIALAPGFQVVLEAIDPSTGASVAGVVITDATIYAENVDDDGGEGILRSIFLVAGGG